MVPIELLKIATPYNIHVCLFIFIALEMITSLHGKWLITKREQNAPGIIRHG